MNLVSVSSKRGLIPKRGREEPPPGAIAAVKPDEYTTERDLP
jgi:hypothetical protein